MAFGYSTEVRITVLSMTTPTPEEVELPFAHSIQEAARTLIAEYPEFPQTRDPERIREIANHSLQFDFVNKLIQMKRTSMGGLYVLAEHNMEYAFPILIEVIAIDALPFEQSEQAEARNFLYGFVQDVLSHQKKALASYQLGFGRHNIDYAQLSTDAVLAPERIASLEKFQRGLLERAAPTPPSMRR